MNDTKYPKTVIITGGGRGLGRAIAWQLAPEYNIIIVGRTQADLVSLCNALLAKGYAADYVVGDVAVPETADRAVVKAAQLGWEVSHLVCNAGIGKSRITYETPIDEWHHIIGVNLHGSFYFSRAVLPHMVAQKSGVICFISSIAGIKGYSHEAAYVASKHAVVGLSKSIALEYGKLGISAVALCPGFIEGDMTKRTIHGVAKRKTLALDAAEELIARQNPQHRIIPAEEVAEMVAIICANKVPSLSGNPIIMSGGA